MVEVLIPNSIVNRSLHLPDYNTTSSVLGSPLGSPYAGLGSTNDRYTLSSYDNEVRGSNGTNDTPPPSCDNTVTEKVLRQVEWYFSDENLLKDAFLMKHITRNKHGYVSLKLVASLRKIKAITKDCKVVSECIKHSESLELNDDGTKVRRINPVPDVDYSGIPKTIIITNYSGLATPEDQADPSGAIQREYSRYGNISRVLVLAPGKAIPLAIKSCKARFPCIGRELCILVEYVSQEMAVKALKESQRNWRQTATVQLLSSQQDHTEDALDQTPSTTTDKKQRNTGNTSTPAVKKQDTTTSKSVSSRTRQLKNTAAVNNNSNSTSDYGSDSGYSGASRSPSLSPKSSPAPVSRNATPLRLETTLKIKPISTSPLVSVIRKPKGPDGTRGFRR